MQTPSRMLLALSVSMLAICAYQQPVNPFPITCAECRVSSGKSYAKGQSRLGYRVRGQKALLMQGAQLAEDPSPDKEAHDARLSADMAARVAAVSTISQLAQMASQPQRQPNDSPVAPSDMQHAGMLLQPEILDTKEAFWETGSL